MDIGTAKPSLADRESVTHHLVDIVEPSEPFTASDWLAGATAVISDCRSRGVLPIVVGGTHLYIKLLLDGMFDGPGADEALRRTLRARGLPALREELSRVDPQAAERIHPHDQRRTIRALEVYRLTGKPISSQQRQWDAGREPGDYQLVILAWPTGAINRRINARVKQMFAQGLVEEVRELDSRGVLGAQAREALGYKQVLRHLRGSGTAEEAAEQVKVQTRRFAKNQRTWLRRLSTAPDTLTLTLPEHAGEPPIKAWTQSILRALHVGG
jgi:tRNA dimethylallyltransferase